jgi:putative mycofactocin binding protein MftB
VLNGRSDKPRSVLNGRSDKPRSVVFDPALGWRLHPQVSVRPESFGALLYHFGTRKLSFLKDRTILKIVQSLDEHADARTACRAAGVSPDGERPYLHALGVLADSNMLVTKE